MLRHCAPTGKITEIAMLGAEMKNGEIEAERFLPLSRIILYLQQIFSTIHEKNSLFSFCFNGAHFFFITSTSNLQNY